MRCKRTVLLLSLMVLAVMVFPAFGQTEEPPQRASPVQPFLGPPGARALALGGAFIGVADDATAAESNPAGLTILTRPEVSLHILSRSADPPQNCPECTSDSSVSPGFASYVQPMSAAVYSIYYSSGLDTETGLDASLGDEIVVLSNEQTLRRFGIAGAFRPFPKLSVGATVSLNRMSSRTNVNLVFPVGFENPDGSVVPGLVEFDDRVETNDTAITYNVGVLLNPTGRVSLGAVYKSDGEFEGEDRLLARACANCSLAGLRTLPFDETLSDVRTEVPSLWGAGVSVRPFSRALLALDYTIQKSRAAFVSQEDQEIRALRVGAEYVIAVPNSSVFIPVRIGYAREKDSDFNTSDFPREKANTVSLGAGFVSGSNQIDIAFSRGYTITTNEKVRQIIVSGIRRF